MFLGGLKYIPFLFGIIMNVWESEVKPVVVTLHFQGKDESYLLGEDGKYRNEYGTALSDNYTDPGYAGLDGILETGKGDPWWKRIAQKHDRAFNNMKSGYQDSAKDNLRVFGEFTTGVATGMLEGAYLLASGPAYWLIGGVGGAIKWAIDTRKNT